MIYVIGIGLKGRKSLLDGPLGIIEGAGLVVGGKRHLDEFPAIKGRRFQLGKLDDAASVIGRHAGRGEDVAVLATGDPLMFGVGSFIIKKFGKANVEVIPNVSTIQEAFSLIKEDMNGVKVISAHGRALDLDGLCNEVSANGKVAIFTDGDNSPGRLAKALSERGFGKLKAFVCESIGAKGEKAAEGTLEKIAKRKSFAPLNVFIILNGNASAGKKRFGIPDTAFSHSSGMITKEEFRVISLVKLAIGPDDIVWDIGACSGSVSVEAARLTSNSVYAIERDPKRLGDMEENRKKFLCHNMAIVKGEAPKALKGLPKPDAVFIGGGGERITEILAAVSKALKPGGRVVVNAVTMETAGKSFGFFEKMGWAKELLLVNISKTKSVGGLNMLSAHNPLFIIKGNKP